MTDRPEYESHKVVRAARIMVVDTEFPGDPVLWVRPEGRASEVNDRFIPTHIGMLHEARVGDWAMLYPDGYKSISPAEAFEEGYVRKP